MRRRKSPLSMLVLGIACCIAVSPLRVIATPGPPTPRGEASWLTQLSDLVQSGIEALRTVVDKAGAVFDPSGLTDGESSPIPNPKPSASSQR